MTTSGAERPPGLTPFQELARRALEIVGRCAEQSSFLLPSALSTGREALDRDSGGLLAGDVLRIRGARRLLLRGMLQLALDVARHGPASDRRVVLCMPEAQEDFVALELLSIVSHIPDAWLRDPSAGEDDHGPAWDPEGVFWTEVNEAARSIARLPLWLDVLASSVRGIDRALLQLERCGDLPAGTPRVVIILGAQQSWPITLQGEALGHALRRLARRRRAAVLWVEESDGELPPIPRALLTGELTLFDDESTDGLVLSWHRRALQPT